MQSLLPARFPLAATVSRGTIAPLLSLSGSTSNPRRPLRFSTTMSAAADTLPSPEPEAPGTDPAPPPPSAADVVVQYVVLRRDLIDSWPLGSTVAQGCHAAVAAVWSHRDHPDTTAYCSADNLDTMHKVTLEVKGETQLLNLAEKLVTAGVAHKLWIEQPENIPTCIATRPYPRSQVASFFKKLKLCK